MKYGFIGCGNMGGAIARTLSNSTKDIMLSGYHPEKAAQLANELGCQSGDNETVLSNCERIFLAVKPQVMADVLAPLKSLFAEKKPLVITMAAGITVARITELLGTDLPIIRIMPNTPVAVGSGMVLYCRNDLVDAETLSDFLTDVAPCGQWDLLDEALIDAAGVVSGCGPAYMYMFMNALADGAEACGVPKEKALNYAAATMIGAAKMVQQTGIDPITLKNNVCSPGGSTLAGVKALDDGQFTETVIKCVDAAYKRNQELGKN